MEIRENRAFAHEIKFLIPAGRKDEVRAWACDRLQPDPFAEAASGNTYRTTSLTIDDDVRAAEIDGPAFCPEKEGVPLLQGEAILEMKFRLAMPVVFKQLLQEFRLGPQSVSKYRLAVPVLAAAKEMAAAYA